MGVLGSEITGFFTSVTLDSGNDFAYIKRITDLRKAKTAQVGSSLNLSNGNLPIR